VLIVGISKAEINIEPIQKRIVSEVENGTLQIWKKLRRKIENGVKPIQKSVVSEV
jgi:hypothetical protein